MTDENRIERLTELARKVWPGANLSVEDDSVCVLGPLQEDPGRVWCAEAIRMNPHPNVLDGLEAALLVMAGPEALREFAYAVVAREKPEPAWTCERPTQVGWYWIRYPSGEPTMLRLFIDYRGQLTTDYNDGRRQYSLDDYHDCSWLGPLSVPQ